MRTKHLVTILVFLALAARPSPVHASGIVSICDEAHLLAALAGGGAVTFSCSGTITLTAEITIAADTTVDGSGQTVTISGNHAVRAFYVNSGVTLNLHSLTVTNGNVGNGAGGGIFNNGTLTMSSCAVSGNIAYSGGGGIENGGTLTMSNCAVSGNIAYSGGGGIDNGGTLTVSNSIFSGNRTDGIGGGIFTGDQSTLTMSNSTFSGNIADYAGGGIYNARSYSNFGMVNVSNSTFSGNSASEGGGIDNRAILTVSNSTFSGNNAGYGGGIYDSWILTVSNSTFSGNSASPAGGGGIYESNRPATLKNTIVANNRPGGNCVGAIADGGGNLSYPGTSCPGINGDPLLGPLQNNGGPTETMALGRGSAALDAANDAVCAADPVNNLDQRGVTRPLGSHCDIGAVEQEPYPSLPSRMWLPAVQSQ